MFNREQFLLGIDILMLHTNKPSLRFNPLTPSSDQHLSSPYNIIPKSHIKVMRMKRIAPTREALDYETNSPHQHLRECMGNSMENMHSDLTVKGAKANEVV